ncbi:MAG: hypothetical protein HDS74_04025 [Bacteroidales bacterium]|nr:hypothetical protein [Bacteroidales bacterium]
MKKFYILLAAGLLMPGFASAGENNSLPQLSVGATRALPTLNIDIKPGVVNEISQFSVDALGAGMVINPETDKTVTLNKDGEVFAEFISQCNDNVLHLSLITPVTNPGVYDVVIPEGYLLVEATPYPETTFAGYSVEKKEIPQEIVITPSAGGQINELVSCQIYWRGYDSVFIEQENMDYDTTKIMFTMGDAEYPSTAFIEVTDEGTIYTFSPREPISGEGRLRLTIPKDQITINGQHPSRDVSYYWNVVPEEGGSLDITPAPGAVGSIGDFVIQLPAETETIARGSGTAYDITLYKYEESFQAFAIVANYSARISQANKTITLSAGDVFTAKGQYKLTIPTSYFVIDGKNCPSQNFIYEVDPELGVNTVEAADGLFNVYGADGRVIILNAVEDDVKALDGGLYIINGKKTIITK